MSTQCIILLTVLILILRQDQHIQINTKARSTHPELFQQFMKEHNGQYDIGLMFDGDADRQILVRPSGTEPLLRIVVEA